MCKTFDCIIPHDVQWIPLLGLLLHSSVETDCSYVKSVTCKYNLVTRGLGRQTVFIVKAANAPLVISQLRLICRLGSV